MSRWLDSSDFTTDIKLLDTITEVGHGGVSRIVGAKDLDSLFDLVRPVDIVHYVDVSTNANSTKIIIHTGNYREGLIVPRIP